MSILKVAAIQNAAGVEVYTAKAWVNFNGTGTVAIRAAGNVSSITDNGTGDYTVNFTTAMADANYAVCGSAAPGDLSNAFLSAPGAAPTASAVRIESVSGANANTDYAYISVAIFR